MANMVYSIMAESDHGSSHYARVAFGRRVRAIREDRRLSQEQLAEIAGIHRTYISSVERGQRNIGLDNILTLAAALQVPVADLFKDL